MSVMEEVQAGAVGGLAGGMVMTAAMMAGKKTGMIEEPVPLKIEREVEERLGAAESTGPKQEKALALGEHLAISVAYGAGYGALRSALGLPAIPSGPLYGLGVYALNLVGLGPALGLTPGPWNEEPMTAGRRMMMHAVYGTVTALVSEQVRQRGG
jgi:hypothetical protein